MKAEPKKSPKGRAKRSIPQFIDEVKREVKKVTWPSRNETKLTTIYVFVFAIIASIYFVLVDKTIVALLEFIRGL